MKPALLEFERSTDDLTQLLNRSSVEEELLRASAVDVTPEEVRDALNRFRRAVEPFVLRQAQYAMQLVLLYGAFERLIEGFLVGTITTLNELVPTYAELPQRIQDNHRRKSLDSLRDDIWLGRSNDSLLSAKLIECLHSCEAQAANYKLNSLTYGRHSANFRRATIDDGFREVGIDKFLLLTSASPEFKQYLAAGPREKGLLDADFGAIDDLAERRNEIAHGSPTQLLSRDQIADYVEFFRAFARSSYTVLRRHLARFLVAHHAISLGKIEQVHYRRVFCLDLGVLPEGTWVEVDDPIAVDLGARSGYEIGAVTNIRTGVGDVKKLRSENGVTVCMETSVRLHSNQKIFLVDRNCPSAWILDSSGSNE